MLFTSYFLLLAGSTCGKHNEISCVWCNGVSQYVVYAIAKLHFNYQDCWLHCLHILNFVRQIKASYEKIQKVIFMEFHLCLGFLVSKSCLNSIMFRKARKTKQQLKRKKNAVHFLEVLGFWLKEKKIQCIF